MKQQSGFTLLELLIAAAIMLVLLGALSSMLISTGNAYNEQSEREDKWRQGEAAVDQLAYDLSLAGYHGANSDDYKANDTTLGTQDALSITVNSSQASPDSINVRYFENRYYGLTNTQAATERRVLRQYQFALNTSTKTLNRTDLSTNTVTPVINEVANFKVIEMSKDGVIYRCPAPATNTTEIKGECPLLFNKATISGFKFKITFTNGEAKTGYVTLANTL